MLFQRRNKPALMERVRVFLWPRRGWRRSTLYIAKRVLRLNGTPHAIALGVAAGVFVSFTPFIGLHFVIAFAVAWITGGNFFGAVLGTFIGNPLTFPVIWATTFHLGNWMLGKAASVPFHFNATKSVLNESFEVLWPLIKPMAVAGIPMGIIFAIGFYFPTRAVVEAYQTRRRRLVNNKSGAAGPEANPS
ncbi:MAG TPA: DUF2062 domain-containing protein [Hyphomicrobiales bacterium]|nr:DUF2062 domain-containing protein [Hyphomicrobiales bacterium]